MLVQTIKSAVSTPARVISLLLVAAMSVSMMGLATACAPKPQPAVEIPPIVVDTSKVIEILADEADSKILYADTTANLVTATESNEKPKPLFIGDGGNGDLTRASGKAVSVAIYMRDISAFSDYEAGDESTTQQAGYKPQAVAFNPLNSITVAAADTKTYPYQDWDKFQQDFYNELQKLGCVGNTPFEYMNGVSSTRSGQVTADLSHNGSNYFVGQLQGGASTRENLALFEGEWMLNITGAQLARAWWASLGHKATLELGGAYGLGVSEGVNEYDEPQLFFAYNTVIPFSGDLASVLPRSDKPAWFDKPEEPVVESETEEPVEEPIVEEPEAVEIDPGGIADGLDDAIDHLIPPTEPDEAAGGDKIIDDPDDPKTGIGGWPEGQPIVIDPELAADLPISSNVKNDFDIGGDTFTQPVDSDGDGWADEVGLKGTNGITNDKPIGVGFYGRGVDISLSFTVIMTPEWFDAAETYVNTLISVEQIGLAQQTFDIIAWYQNTYAPNETAFIERVNSFKDTVVAAETAKAEAEAAAAAAAAANNAGTGGSGGGASNNSGNEGSSTNEGNASNGNSDGSQNGGGGDVLGQDHNVW